MDTELVKIKDVVFDPQNARVHNEANLKAIANSLKEFGQRKPIVLYKGTVIAGNGTLEAAASLGWKEITVTHVPEDWTDEQARAFALADNRTSELAEWDPQVLSDQLFSLSEDGFNITDIGFAAVLPDPTTDAPDDFPSFDEDTEAKYCCPKCGYEWNGSPN